MEMAAGLHMSSDSHSTSAVTQVGSSGSLTPGKLVVPLCCFSFCHGIQTWQEGNVDIFLVKVLGRIETYYIEHIGTEVHIGLD